VNHLVKLCLLALASGLPVAGAQAADDNELNLGRMTAGYSYFNKPFADTAMHNADVSACLADAANMRSFGEQLRPTGLLPELMADSATRGTVMAGVENCMVVHGWRVVHLSDAEGATLAALPPADLMARLSPWIGAETPHGDVVRVWHNDAALAAVNHFSLHASHSKDGDLSLLALASLPNDALKANRAEATAATEHPQKIILDPKWKKPKLKPEMLDAAPEGSAIIIIGVSGISLRQGNGFVFNRMGPDIDTQPSAIDHGLDEIAAGAGAIGGSGLHIMAFAVPPGRWRIYSMFGGGISLNFCLGAPSFEAKAGEVIYAGALNLKQEKLAPDQSLDAVRAWAGGAKAVERVKPAIWTNGSRSKCAPNSLYALEFEGAPFEQGYALGSKATALKAAQ
jgi:hypothetical protein